MQAMQPGTALSAMREKTPLVHNITNYVVMNSTANALLAAGAAPVMAHAVEEMPDMVGLASALVLNIGTLSPAWVESMQVAGKAAADRGIPIILDPVGAGATPYRTQTANALLSSLPLAVLRGNASEILALAGADATTRGVDSTQGSSEAREAAEAIARERNVTVVVTGVTDFITDGRCNLNVQNGHPLMSRVTGTGCAATALIAAFCAAQPDFMVASAAALAFYGLAGERAAAVSGGPGTFWPSLLDELYRLTPQELDAGANIG